ncbi:ABC transporter ATP-binding protein [Brevibacillus fortis]|uniref:ABC transporter ATP-binding protein n=1 Tax=Brevibacillus fortis TaxID=2126352 RepID=A0A2P7V1R8_9BACL|nr:ABC transporter ATP-binding protein [Brevibacillus fortis]MED1780204.1 ABC transporter ATP-binding protein [Brevibacillus fortis]PSJ93164.1 ABC transporter ATP-binding protein [Brevibacillus fortis]
MRVIECEGLTKEYKDHKALKNVTFSVDGIGCVGFLGGNGAGKTTTIRILTGLAAPTGGKVRVVGYDVVTDRNKVTSEVGYCPQIPAFYNYMTATEWMHWVGKLYGLDKHTIAQRTDELLELCGINEARNRPISGYSGGMKQRLGIAQALIHNPKLLVLDEPVSALDPMGRYDVLLLIEKLKQHMTVFMSTHILDDIERIADHIVIIKDGTVVLSSSLEQLRANHVEPLIEFKLDQQDIDLTDVLNGLTWIREWNLDGGIYKVLTNDMEKAKALLPHILLETGGTLAYYHLSVSTLEDIFLKVVNN